VQEAVLPRWLPRALLALAAAAAALAVLWFTVLSPVIKNTATAAGTDAAHQELNKALQNAQQAAGGAGAGTAGGAGGGGKGAGASPSPTGAATQPAPAASPVIALPPPVPLSVELDPHTTSITAAAKHQLSITDLVLQNPAGDKGALTISVGGKVLLNTRLNNFRDYDLPFVTPIAVAAGQTLQLKVSCENTGGTPCTPAVLVNGTDATVSF
jgi:hypothetical protein